MSIYEEVVSRLRSYPPLRLVFELLEEHADLDVYVVGGVPRDVALGRVSDPKDVDFMLGGTAVGAAIDAISRAGQMRRGPFGSPRWFPANAGIYCERLRLLTQTVFGKIASADAKKLPTS